MIYIYVSFYEMPIFGNNNVVVLHIYHKVKGKLDSKQI